MTNEQIIIDAIKAGTANILTPLSVKSLTGKKIITYYAVYVDQYGVDSFIVGEVKEIDWIRGYEDKIRELYTIDGRNTYIRHHFMLGNNFFSCSDSDRAVYYIECN